MRFTLPETRIGFRPLCIGRKKVEVNGKRRIRLLCRVGDVRT